VVPHCYTLLHRLGFELGLPIYERLPHHVSFCAQTEHAIGQSYPAETAKDNRSSGDTQSPPQEGMTADNDGCDSEADAHYHAQGTIHSSDIEERRHNISSL
jgi:hypothetical protein